MWLGDAPVSNFTSTVHRNVQEQANAARNVGFAP